MIYIYNPINDIYNIKPKEDIRYVFRMIPDISL